MKKRIVALIALCMLLSCLSGLADGAPTRFERVGIDIDFRDIQEDSPFYMELRETGVADRDPFVACLYLDYYAVPRDILRELIDGYGEEEQDAVGGILEETAIAMANIIVTDAQSPEAAIDIALGQLPEGAEVVELGEAEPYRWFAVLLPVGQLPDDYEGFAAFGLEPRAVRPEAEAVLADMERVRAAFVERLGAAEMYPPVDPDAGAVKNDSGDYRVIVSDPEGNPVEGAVIQFCDDVTCAFQTTGADGVASFAVEQQKVYEVHVLMAPEGYAPDDGVYKTLDTYSDVNIFLEKAA